MPMCIDTIRKSLWLRSYQYEHFVFLLLTSTTILGGMSSRTCALLFGVNHTVVSHSPAHAFGSISCIGSKFTPHQSSWSGISATGEYCVGSSPLKVWKTQCSSSFASHFACHWPHCKAKGSRNQCFHYCKVYWHSTGYLLLTTICLSIAS